MAKHQADCSNSGEDFGELSFSALELQALNYLDESIRFHDTQTEDNCFNNRFGSESRLMDQRNLSNQVFRIPRESQAQKNERWLHSRWRMWNEIRFERQIWRSFDIAWLCFHYWWEFRRKDLGKFIETQLRSCIANNVDNRRCNYKDIT